MAVNINSLSIDTNPSGFHSLFDYADMLQELADEIDSFRRTYRSSLSNADRTNLRLGAVDIRFGANKLATRVGILVLTNLQSDLDKLRNITADLDSLIQDIANTQAIISGIAKVLGVITNILTIVP